MRLTVTKRLRDYRKGIVMAVTVKDQLAQMARYHVWATRRLLESIEAVPDEQYHKACGLFFQSIHGTLNHLLLTDSEIWYPRFTGGLAASGPLDAELESDRTELASRLLAATARWPQYVATLDATDFASDLRFTMTTGEPRVLQIASALLHLFNHATHHRGQITAGMSMLGFPYQQLDLPFMIFAEAA
jgi:uncharacterized damage-inducible protein DinB